MNFDKAIISLLDGRTIEVKIKNIEAERYNMFKIEATNGITYNVCSHNCVLIKE
jgi:hypothetical protein